MADTGKIEGIPQQSHNISLSRSWPPLQQASKNPRGDRPQADAVELSPENTEYQRALKHIDQVPDIRLDRVERIRNALESGTYHIDSDRVADRLIQESLINDLTTNQPPDSPPNPTMADRP